ncbi:MAG: formyltransferase family protein [Candidatus Bathyarchaeota archaeon]
MTPEPIFNPKKGAMRVACFASGSGTNARRIIARSLETDSWFEVVLLFSDVQDDRATKSGEKICRAKDIAEEYGIAYECIDIRDFYKKKGVPRSDLSVRPEFDKMVVEFIVSHNVDLICNAGYMSIMTQPILEAYSGRIINVHPADLTIMEGLERKYVGIHVVEEAIMAGEKELRATTHMVREKVDHGEILVVSEPVPVKLPAGVSVMELAEDKALRGRVVEEHQDRLKRRGDWVIYPLTVQLIAEGRFSLGKGKVYFNGKQVPQGVRLPRDLGH